MVNNLNCHWWAEHLPIVTVNNSLIQALYMCITDNSRCEQ